MRAFEGVPQHQRVHVVSNRIVPRQRLDVRDRYKHGSDFNCIVAFFLESGEMGKFWSIILIRGLRVRSCFCLPLLFASYRHGVHLRVVEHTAVNGFVCIAAIVAILGRPVLLIMHGVLQFVYLNVVHFVV